MNFLAEGDRQICYWSSTLHVMVYLSSQLSIPYKACDKTDALFLLCLQPLYANCGVVPFHFRLLLQNQECERSIVKRSDDKDLKVRPSKHFVISGFQMNFLHLGEGHLIQMWGNSRQMPAKVLRMAFRTNILLFNLHGSCMANLLLFAIFDGDVHIITDDPWVFRNTA